MRLSHVIGVLKQMHPRDEEAQKQIEKTITYLTNNKDRSGYKGVKVGSYPIGSGGIQSANKFICHVWLKRSGTWYSSCPIAIACSSSGAPYSMVLLRICSPNVPKS
jgi:hypothetical protein